jgi:hypothetical protein
MLTVETLRRARRILQGAERTRPPVEVQYYIVTGLGIFHHADPALIEALGKYNPEIYNELLPTGNSISPQRAH